MTSICHNEFKAMTRRALKTNFIDIIMKIKLVSVKEMQSKISSVTWWSFCLGISVLIHIIYARKAPTTWMQSSPNIHANKQTELMNIYIYTYLYIYIYAQGEWISSWGETRLAYNYIFCITIVWWPSESGHQKAYYWYRMPGIFQVQHSKVL